MKKTISTSCIVAALLLQTIPLYADQVEMQNGDRYVGKVLSLDTNTLVLKNDNLGTIQLPRGKVTNVTFGANPPPTAAPVSIATNSQPAAPAVVTTNGQADLSASLKALGANTNFIKQVQSQFLAAAGPEANAKFNEMVSGMMSGKMDINGLRAQAKQAAANLKQLKREVGDDTGMLDGYLSILENFLHESEPATNSPPPKAKQN
ncbi:MAG: hypothetical protein ACXWIU_13025 [Limisphaerales bacterium]